MPIQTIARYRVRLSGVDKVKRAIAEFVPYVRANEPGTRLYLAWQEKDDPTRFVHFSSSKMRRRTPRTPARQP
jgi:quinol monooxygenase YgiN